MLSVGTLAATLNAAIPGTLAQSAAGMMRPSEPLLAGPAKYCFTEAAFPYNSLGRWILPWLVEPGQGLDWKGSCDGCFGELHGSSGCTAKFSATVLLLLMPLSFM